MELEPNPTNMVAVVVSGIFIAMVWKIPTWNTYPITYKWLITILLPILSYVIGSFYADR